MYIKNLKSNVHKVSFVTDKKNGKSILKHEKDEKSFFLDVKKVLEKLLLQENLKKDEINNIETGIFIYTLNAMQPYNFSFINSQKRSNYIGMGSSKIFRCTPTNALASFLAIEYGVKGTVLTAVGKGKDRKSFYDYCKLLKLCGDIKRGIFIDINIRYKDLKFSEAVEKIKINNFIDSEYYAHIDCELI